MKPTTLENVSGQLVTIIKRQFEEVIAYRQFDNDAHQVVVGHWHGVFGKAEYNTYDGWMEVTAATDGFAEQIAQSLLDYTEKLGMDMCIAKDPEYDNTYIVSFKQVEG